MKPYANTTIDEFLTAETYYRLKQFRPTTRDEYLKHAQTVFNLKLNTSFPLIVHLETTNKCNLKCRMCQHPDMKREKIDIEPSLAYKVIDECIEQKAWFLHFFFFGEPFLNPKTIDYLQYAKDKGFHNISLTTNFTTVSQQTIQELVEIPLESITISFEGLHRDKYSLVRGWDYFDKVRSNIDALLSARKKAGQDRPWVTLTYVRTDESDEEIEKFQKAWSSKVNAIHISPQFDYLGRSQLSQQNECNSGNLLSRSELQRLPCRQLWLRLVVMSNGDIVPCSQNMDGELSLGNIRDISLQIAWEGQKLAELRGQHISNKIDTNCICHRCIDWDWSGRFDNRPKLK